MLKYRTQGDGNACTKQHSKGFESLHYPLQRCILIWLALTSRLVVHIRLYTLVQNILLSNECINCLVQRLMRVSTQLLTPTQLLIWIDKHIFVDTRAPTTFSEVYASDTTVPFSVQ